MDAESSQSLQKRHNSTLKLSFTPEKNILDLKLKMCSLEKSVYALHEFLNPKLLDDVLPELLFNHFLRVLYMSISQRAKKK